MRLAMINFFVVFTGRHGIIQIYPRGVCESIKLIYGGGNCMATVSQVTAENASPEVKELFAMVEQMEGMVPVPIQVMVKHGR